MVLVVGKNYLRIELGCDFLLHYEIENGKPLIPAAEVRDERLVHWLENLCIGRFCFVRRGMGNYLDDGLVLMGALLVTVGAGMVYFPSGVMVTGGFFIIAGFLVRKCMGNKGETVRNVGVDRDAEDEGLGGESTLYSQGGQYPGTYKQIADKELRFGNLVL